jgi:hypothetical protein
MATFILPAITAYGCYQILFGKYSDDKTIKKPINTTEMLLRIGIGVPVSCSMVTGAGYLGMGIDAFMTLTFFMSFAP